MYILVGLYDRIVVFNSSARVDGLDNNRTAINYDSNLLTISGCVTQVGKAKVQ